MTAQRLARRLAGRLRRGSRKLRDFGGAKAKHRLFTVFGRDECTVALGGVGPVTVRTGEPDLVSFLRILRDGEYEPPVAEILNALRTREAAIQASGKLPVIVDAGAYVGASAIWFLTRFPHAHVVAIEPDPASFRLLSRNLASFSRSEALEAAVGASRGHAAVVPTPQSWGNRVERSAAGVDMVTMDDAFATVADGEPFIAKINIEGFEEELFAGNLDWLDRVSALFIEPHDWLFPDRHTSRSFQKALGARDFRLFIVGPHLLYVRA